MEKNENHCNSLDESVQTSDKDLSSLRALSTSITPPLFNDSAHPLDKLFTSVAEGHPFIGIGCDIVEIIRFRQAIERAGKPLLHKILTSNEIKMLEGMKDPYPSYAARFAAKEALSKALGCGIGEVIGWHDMEILKDQTGKPSVAWSKSALKHFPIAETYLSLSHSKNDALAFAIITRR